jgi:nucleotide sugar dehydrogenase
MKKSIGVIGQGFVGGTLTTVFAERGAIVYPFNKEGTYKPGASKVGDSFPTSIAELVTKCESQNHFFGIYFVCVPTPMFPDGSADVRIVESVLSELAAVDGNRTVVIKSTVPPGSTEKWNAQHLNLCVVFNPEFLTEANALDDMRHQTRIVLGGQSQCINEVRDLYHTFFPDVPILKTSHATTAEMVKYFTNLQLAVRVILSCELWQICDALSNAGHTTNYDRVVEFASYDERLGRSHMNVPGSEGVPGARGHCFPKDLNALVAVAKKLGVNPTILSAAWKKNLELIPAEHRDWEFMKGRAVS